MSAIAIGLGIILVVVGLLFLSAISEIDKLNSDNTELEEQIRNFQKPAEPKPISAPIKPEWLSSDALNLRNFFNTETGRRFRGRGRAMEYANAVAGCNDLFHTTQSASKAAGFGECLNWQDSLASEEIISRVTGELATKQNTSNSEQDDAALLERFSP